MKHLFQIALVAIVSTVVVWSVGCKRGDDGSRSTEQAVSSLKKSGSTDQPEETKVQPRSAAAPAVKPVSEPSGEGEREAISPGGNSDGIEGVKSAAENRHADKGQGPTLKKEPVVKPSVEGDRPLESAKRPPVVIPRSERVWVDVPERLQALLNNDSRMQPWVDKVMKVADSCQAKQAGATSAGVIVVQITMHQNSRPDADIKSLPPQLAGIVACATGELMRTRMPLFTGPEGERHTLRIHFGKP